MLVSVERREHSDETLDWARELTQDGESGNLTSDRLVTCHFSLYLQTNHDCTNKTMVAHNNY